MVLLFSLSMFRSMYGSDLSLIADSPLSMSSSGDSFVYSSVLSSLFSGSFHTVGGFHFALMVFLYAPVRLVLDTLRVSEKTYWGLTMGQCGSIAFLGLGIYLVIRGLKKRVHYTRTLKTSDGPIRTQ